MTNTFDPLTVEEFARATRRTPSAVRQAIGRGRLPAVRIGRRWFIDPAYFARQFEMAARAVEAQNDPTS